jgi:hypothetical protein
MSTADLTPIPLTINVTRATTRRLQLTLTSAGAPVNLTGATVTLTVKTHASQAETPPVYTVNAVHSDPTNGVTILTIPKMATFGTDGQLSRYVHEIRLIQGNGEEIAWWKGNFLVYPTPAP